jgi:hypothetical protein
VTARRSRRLVVLHRNVSRPSPDFGKHQIL